MSSVCFDDDVVDVVDQELKRDFYFVNSSPWKEQVKVQLL